VNQGIIVLQTRKLRILIAFLDISTIMKKKTCILGKIWLNYRIHAQQIILLTMFTILKDKTIINTINQVDWLSRTT
jgi:hypothetical protein